jgi:hypothetical protein
MLDLLIPKKLIERGMFYRIRQRFDKIIEKV